MKKLCIILIAFAICFAVFAQNAKSTGLTDSDVKAFCKNYGEIQTELRKTGIELDDTSTAISASTASPKINQILNKNGISGNNPLEKIEAIVYSFAIEKYEAEIASDPQSAALLKKMGLDPMKELKSRVADSDRTVVRNNLAAVSKAFDAEIAASDFSEEDVSSFMEDYGGLDYESLAQAFQNVADEDKNAVAKKYDTKKKFKTIKYDNTEWILVQPTDITFENSDEAALYAEAYTGVKGTWEICSSFGYLGTNNGKKPFYVWLSGGIGYYSKFPVDFAGGKPDKFIPDEEVTPALAKKTILQMYRLND